MQIILTADLHYGLMADGDASTEALARKVCGRGGDALVLCGDLAIRSTDKFRACLELFADFPGARMFVAGNHDLWCPPHDPWSRYERILGEIGRECGFHGMAQPFSPTDLGWLDAKNDQFRQSPIQRVCQRQHLAQTSVVERKAICCLD